MTSESDRKKKNKEKNKEEILEIIKKVSKFFPGAKIIFGEKEKDE